MAKSRGRKFAEITSPTSGVFDLTSVPTITNAKLQNSAMTLAGSSVSLGGTGVADTDALSEGSSNLYFTDARVQTFLGGGTLAGNIVVPDNRSIYVGSSSDFRIVHNTTNTQLVNATGALQITSNGGVTVTGATTFSADLTVDTNTLKVDSSNNRVGIGTSSPASLIHGMSGDLFLTANSTSADSGQGLYFQSTTSGWTTSSAHAAIFGKRTDASNGYLRFDVRQSGTTEEAMRIDSSGRVGIGVSSINSDSLLHLKSAQPNIYFEDTDDSKSWRLEAGAVFKLQNITASAEAFRVDQNGKVSIGTTSTGGLPLQTKVSSGDNKFRQTTANKDAFTLGLENSTGNTIIGTHTKYPHTTFRDDGNVGIGSAGMPSYSGQTQLSIGPMAHFMAESTSGTSRSLHISQNAHLDADGSWETMETDEASNYYQYAGTHAFRVAASTSAGTDITWTTALSIINDGSVGIGTSSPSGIFHVRTASGTHRSRFESANSHSLVRIIAGTGSNAGLEFFSGSGNVGNITADSSSNFIFEPGGSSQMTLNTSGQLYLASGRVQATTALMGTVSGYAMFGSNSASEPIMISRDFTTSYPDITISTAGKVGINTASPAYTLTVEKQVTGDWLSRIYNTGTAEGDHGVLVRADSTHDGTAVLAVYSGAYRAWFQGDGKVGIGYTDPLSAFHVKRHGGLLYNGGETSNNTIDNQASRDNYWTYHGCAGFSGTRSGNFRLTIPDCNNSASSAGYGSWSVEIYLSGYNGKYAHAFVSGYVNVSMNISESAFRASSGYHSLSYGMNGTQGFYVDIDTPGYVHGSAYWRVTKSGDPTAGRWTRLSNAVANWT